MQLDVRSRLARAARNSLKMRNFTIRIGTQRGSQMANCFILFTERSPEWSKMRSLSFLDSLLAIRKRSIRWLILPLHCFLSGEWSRNLAVTALICGSCMPGFEKYVASMFGRMTMASRSNRRRSVISTLMIGQRLPKTLRNTFRNTETTSIWKSRYWTNTFIGHHFRNSEAPRHTFWIGTAEPRQILNQEHRILDRQSS